MTDATPEIVNPPTGCPAARGPRPLQVLRQRHRPPGRHAPRSKPGKVTCVLGRQRCREVVVHQDPLRRPQVTTPARCFLDGEEISFSSPRDALDRGIATVYQDLAVVPADVGLAQLLAGRRAQAGRLAGALDRHPQVQAHRQGGAAQDGHRHPRPGAVRGHALRRRAPVGRHRPRRVPRGPGPDPGRAHLRAGRQAVRRGAALHRGGGAAGTWG